MILSWLLRNTYLESKDTLFLSWKIIFQKEKYFFPTFNHALYLLDEVGQSAR